MRQTIIFNDDERVECWEVAKRVTKHLSNVNNDRYNRRHIHSGRFPANQRYMGMLGELAVAKFLGKPFNTRQEVSKEIGSSDGKINGWTYDVKTTGHQKGWLVVPSNMNGATQSDVYIAAYCPTSKENKTTTAEIVGWLWHNEICKPINISNEFKSKPFVVKTGLRSIFTLADATWAASEMQSVNEATHCAYQE